MYLYKYYHYKMKLSLNSKRYKIYVIYFIKAKYSSGLGMIKLLIRCLDSRSVIVNSIMILYLSGYQEYLFIIRWMANHRKG